MAKYQDIAGNWAKASLAALGAAALAVPLAASFAQAPEYADDAGEEVAELSAEQVEEGRTLFTNWSCGACHSLSDAKATGQIGPAFDGNKALDHDFTVNRITNGQGAMPGFGGQLTEDEIDLLSTYIVQTKK